MTLDRATAQLLITKLDLRAITPTEAKAHAARWCNVKLTGRTREQVIGSISRAIPKAPVGGSL
jgi:chorismate mutase